MEQKKLLKKYLDKLTKNKVVYANGKVVRASDLNYTLCCNTEEVDLGDVKIRVKPGSYDMKVVPSTIKVRIYEDGVETVDGMVTMFNSDYTSSKFVSQLTDTQTEKLISTLGPIVSKIDREVALINEEEKILKVIRKKSSHQKYQGKL